MMVKSPPTHAGDTASTPSRGRAHTPAGATEPASRTSGGRRAPEPCPATTGAAARTSPQTAAREEPCRPQPEESHEDAAQPKIRKEH